MSNESENKPLPPPPDKPFRPNGLINAWNSDEFRAFAMAWLGFDPKDRDGPLGDIRWVEIRLARDEGLSFNIGGMANGPAARGGS